MTCKIRVSTGDIPNWRDGGKMRGVILAAKVGYKVLKETGNVTDAVEAAGNSKPKKY